MDMRSIWTWIALVIAAYFAIRLVLWLLGFVIGILQTAVIIAVIIGVIYLLYAIFGRKRQTY